MGWTKRQFIYAAFEELALADYVFDLSPEQIQSAIARLESYVGRLKGINIHWPFSNLPTSANLDADTNCPDYANEAIFLNLAIALAPSYGKALSVDTRKNAIDAYNTMVTWSSDLPPTKQVPSMLAGAGSKSRNIMTEQTVEGLITKSGDILI